MIQNIKYIFIMFIIYMNIMSLGAQNAVNIGSFDKDFQYVGTCVFTITKPMHILVEIPNPNMEVLEGNFSLHNMPNYNIHGEIQFFNFKSSKYTYSYDKILEPGQYFFSTSVDISMIASGQYPAIIIKASLNSFTDINPKPILLDNPTLSSTSENQIKSYTYTKAGGESYLENIIFFDGLGRVRQTTQKKITPSMKDLITFQKYDDFYRDSGTWLPYIHSGETNINLKSQYNDEYPFDEIQYETSNVNRLQYIYNPGKDWQENGHIIKKNYLTNSTTQEDLKIISFSSENHGESVGVYIMQYWSEGIYSVEQTINEDKSINYKFIDLKGRLALSRDVVNKEFYDTYYLYDYSDNLCYVIPPILSSIAESKIKSGTSLSWNINSDELKKYAYIYQYDALRRCVYKKTPGADPIYYVYDANDHLIFSQDGEQRKRNINEWTFNLPDIWGRTVLTGTVVNSALKRDMFTNTSTAVIAEYNGAQGNYGYKILGYLFTPSLITSVNYYDNYDFLGLKDGIPNNINTQYNPEVGYNTKYVDAKNLLTGTMLAQFPSGGMIYSVIYYDDRGRVIQTKSNNHFAGGIEKEYIAYDFLDQPVSKKNTHLATGKLTQTELYSYTYDHAGRLITTRHKLNTGAETLIAHNAYDELGRLLRTTKGGNLTANYTYNIRSWTKSIEIKNGTNLLFKQNIYYNDKVKAHNYSDYEPSYSGNISGMEWQLQGEAMRSNRFKYDELSRLVNSAYNGVISGGAYNTSYTYDKHGNILNLIQNGLVSGASKQIDNLQMSYIGNQLNNVHNVGVGLKTAVSAHFQDYSKDGTKTKKEYSYNANGAMTQDLNKGISSIQYNYINLPIIMDIKSPVGEARNEYTYSASGQKLKVVQKWNPNFNTNPILGSGVTVGTLTASLTTDYVGNKIYENGNLKRILIDGGYVENNKYYYYLTDHLGNNRAVAEATGTLIQKSHYYPFGMAYAESTGGEKQPYKYNGKELDTKHGLYMYDYAARYMDPAIGRFTSIDPLAEKYYSISPYAYVANNPLKYVDPTGMFIDDYFNRDGKYLGNDNSETDYVRVMKQEDWDNNKTSNITIDASVGQQNSALHSKSNITSKASLNIYKHYNPTNLKVAETKDPNTVMAYVNNTVGGALLDEKFEVNINVMKKTGFSDKVSDITNLTIHEEKHYKDLHLFGSDKYIRMSSQVLERRAIETQVSHPSWDSTSPRLKKNMLDYGNSLKILVPGLNAPSLKTRPVIIPTKLTKP